MIIDNPSQHYNQSYNVYAQSNKTEHCFTTFFNKHEVSFSIKIWINNKNNIFTVKIDPV